MKNLKKRAIDLSLKRTNQNIVDFGKTFTLVIVFVLPVWLGLIIAWQVDNPDWIIIGGLYLLYFCLVRGIEEELHKEGD